MAAGFTCTPAPSRAWKGRYARVPGDTTTFHIRHQDGGWWPCVEWLRDGVRADCPMTDAGDARLLIEAVNQAKQAGGARPGGAFLINEHGQILVPVGNTAGVWYAGECSGPLTFHNLLDGDGSTFDLADTGPFTHGQLWSRPYVGIPHNLSRAGEMYFWNEGQDTAGKLLPPSQDATLVTSLRALRAWGPVRFLVGYQGVVITKVPIGQPPNQTWEPRFVGQLDLKRWFKKETPR